MDEGYLEFIEWANFIKDAGYWHEDDRSQYAAVFSIDQESIVYNLDFYYDSALDKTSIRFGLAYHGIYAPIIGNWNTELVNEVGKAISEGQVI